MTTYKALGPDYRPLTIDAGSGTSGTVDQTARDAAAAALAAAQSAYSSYSQTTTVGTLKAANGTTATLNFPTGGGGTGTMPGWEVFQYGTGDDDAELDRCVSLASTSNSNGTGSGVWIGDGRTVMKLIKTHTVDPTKCCIRGNGAKIDTSGRTYSSTANNSLTTAAQNATFSLVCANGSSSNDLQMRGWGGFKLLNSSNSGAGAANSIAFLLNTNESSTALSLSQRMGLYDVNIQGFAETLWFGNRTYLCSFVNCRFRPYTGGNIIRFDNGMYDAGENFQFVNCVMGGTGTVLRAYGQTDVNFVNCSFDFCETFVRGNPIVSFSDCHFEINRSTVDSSHIPWIIENPTTSPATTLHSGTVTIMGGRVQISGPSNLASGVTAYPPDYFVSMDDKSASFTVINTHWYGQGGTTTGQFATDTGDCRLQLRGGPNRELPPIVSRNPRLNLVPNGGFEQPSVAANVYCYVTTTDTTATTTDQWTNSNIHVLMSTADANPIDPPGGGYSAGTRSLLVIKDGAAAKNAVFTMLIPFPARKTPGAMWYSKVSGATGVTTVPFSSYMCTVGQFLANGTAAFAYEENLAGTPPTLTLTDGAIDWTKLAANFGNYSTGNVRDGLSLGTETQYFRIRVDMTSWPAGAQLRFDDMVVNAF